LQSIPDPREIHHNRINSVPVDIVSPFTPGQIVGTPD
jgi:hypothetical protein